MNLLRPTASSLSNRRNTMMPSSAPKAPSSIEKVRKSVETVVCMPPAPPVEDIKKESQIKFSSETAVPVPVVVNEAMETTPELETAKVIAVSEIDGEEFSMSEEEAALYAQIVSKTVAVTKISKVASKKKTPTKSPKAKSPKVSPIVPKVATPKAVVTPKVSKSSKTSPITQATKSPKVSTPKAAFNFDWSSPVNTELSATSKSPKAATPKASTPKTRRSSAKRATPTPKKDFVIDDITQDVAALLSDTSPIVHHTSSGKPITPASRRKEVPHFSHSPLTPTNVERRVTRSQCATTSPK